MQPEAAAVVKAEVKQYPMDAKFVGDNFVQQYYHIQYESPSIGYQFYKDTSQISRPEEDGTMSIAKTIEGINEKILSLEYDQCKVEIKSADAQESYNGGVQVVVIGHQTKNNLTRCFSQVFFLAPQDIGGYFVLNDMFRYIDSDNQAQEGKHTPSEEASGSEVINPPTETLDIQEVVKDVHGDETKMLVDDSSNKIEELPKKSFAKKSFASIVKELKESGATFSTPPPPPPPPSKKSPPPKSQDQASPLPPASKAQHQPHNSRNNQEREANGIGYSIYIKGLPMNTTVALLENEFKRFGPIKKNDGIQVRSNRNFCFGFIKFEVPSAVQKALEASPITIGGGRQIFIEEKKSTYARGRYHRGGGDGVGRGHTVGYFRNDGVRPWGGRGGNYYYHGRGRSVYGNRGDFNGRNDHDFNNRDGTGNRRGSYYNHGGNEYPYQRSNKDGTGRINTAGSCGRGMANGNGAIKNMTPKSV